ncbi:MAG: hypothetical protein HYS23_14565 [Geobacter sp.]|nr:hypothetical protein [Geobacter sp.]
MENCPPTNKTYFEDVLLPAHSLTLDVATKYDHHPEYDDEEDLWFWRFTICGGRLRSDDARTILAHSMNLLAKLLTHEDKVICRRQELAPDEDPYVYFDQWVESLRSIIKASENKDYCFWISGDESDYEFLKDWREKSLLPKDNPSYEAPPHIKDQISKVASAAKKLAKAERVFEARQNKKRKKGKVAQKEANTPLEPSR